MTRLIDADALLKELRKSCEYHAENSRELSLLQRDIIIVQEQPTIDAESHWIPCSERLPEENGTYLVYAPDYRGGSSRGKEWHDGIMFAIFKAGKWSIEHGYYSRPNCVIAWMPLPKPYEVDE